MYSKNTSCNCSLLFGLELLRCTRSHNCINKLHNATISEWSLQMFYIWVETHLGVRNNSESQRNESVQRKMKRMDEKKYWEQRGAASQKVLIFCLCQWPLPTLREVSRQPGAHPQSHYGAFAADKNPHKCNKKNCVLSTHFTLHANWHISLFMKPPSVSNKPD